MKQTLEILKGPLRSSCQNEAYFFLVETWLLFCKYFYKFCMSKFHLLTFSSLSHPEVWSKMKPNKELFNNV